MTYPDTGYSSGPPTPTPTWETRLSAKLLCSTEMFSEMQWHAFPESVHYHQALNNAAPPYIKNLVPVCKDVCKQTLGQQQTVTYISQRHIPNVFGFQAPLSGITYNLMWEELSLHGFTKENQPKYQPKLCMTILTIFHKYCALCCVLHVPLFIIKYMCVCVYICVYI